MKNMKQDLLFNSFSWICNQETCSRAARKRPWFVPLKLNTRAGRWDVVKASVRFERECVVNVLLGLSPWVWQVFVFDSHGTSTVASSFRSCWESPPSSGRVCGHPRWTHANIPKHTQGSDWSSLMCVCVALKQIQMNKNSIGTHAQTPSGSGISPQHKELHSRVCVIGFLGEAAGRHTGVHEEVQLKLQS